MSVGKGAGEGGEGESDGRSKKGIPKKNNDAKLGNSLMFFSVSDVG